MERIRKPFQGLANIVRFNYHFYVLSAIALLLLFTVAMVTHSWYTLYIKLVMLFITATTFISLAISFYVYDLSDLYSFGWLRSLTIQPTSTIVNINAGFDEISNILKEKYPDAGLIVFDFYDPQKHTEVSIKRAGKAYPPYQGTQPVSTTLLPLPGHSVDAVFLFLSAHEIREGEERIHFFKEINRVMKQSATIVVTEHLRDLPNFLAYNIGFFHFHTASTWYRTFQQAGLQVRQQIKITAFITTFILEKNGATS